MINTKLVANIGLLQTYMSVTLQIQHNWDSVIKHNPKSIIQVNIYIVSWLQTYQHIIIKTTQGVLFRMAQIQNIGSNVDLNDFSRC